MLSSVNGWETCVVAGCSDMYPSYFRHGTAPVPRRTAGTPDPPTVPPEPAIHPRGGRPAERPTSTATSAEIEPVEVHDPVPRGHEVTHELLRGVALRVDLRDGPQLRV